MFELSHMVNGSANLTAAVLLLGLFLGTFVSEDAACLAAGTLVTQGRLSFAFALAACFLGIFIGDMLLYFTGRIFGQRIIKTKLFSRFVSESAITAGSAWLEKRGASAVFLSRFVTGLRLPTYLAAGFLRTSFFRFAIYFLIAAAIWTPLVVGASAFAQDFIFPQNTFIGLIILMISMRFAWKFSSWNNRRLFFGRLKRIANWEFWPVQVFYLPVILYALLLGIKHRSLTVFTCANPAIPAGGFKGESKHDIYRGLGSSDAARKFLLPYKLLSKHWPTGEKLIAAKNFIQENKLEFPVVLKPDSGERGKGVEIVDSLEALERLIVTANHDLIVQEFASGVEVSIFYYRRPSETQGNIFSITEKIFPTVIGDGKATLAELILNDSRAVCLAEKYFRHNQDRLELIPSQGEQSQIIDIGTHSRGAIFLDGSRLKTDKLTQKINEICYGFEGFYFGRFDIRADSLEDLMNGENFKIIELNGVTSESTNIYDPKYNLLDAYRILFRQWRIAFEIGAENHKQGAETTSFRTLIRLAFKN